jgi:DNA-binding IclR family transcriptional regulator
MIKPAPRTTGGDRQPGQNVITALRRGLDILDMFSAERRVVGITDIALALDIHKSSASRLAATLASSGYLVAASAGRYTLGPRLAALGSLAASRQDLTAVVTPFLTELVEGTGETGHLAVLDQTIAKTVQVIDGWHTVRMHSWVGKLSPAHCSSMGKALLAGLTDAELGERYPDSALPVRTAHTIGTVTALRQELARIRRSGHSIDNEELEAGLRCVAAPVFSPEGTVDASISISGPAQRLTRDRMAVLAKLVRWHAWQASLARGVLSAPVGWPSAPTEKPATPDWVELSSPRADGSTSRSTTGRVEPREVAEGHSDGEGCPRPGVTVTGPEGRGIADHIEPGQD